MGRKKAKVRGRRSPYESALADAMAKLDKYTDELRKCEERAQWLRAEIPRLHGIINALQPTATAPPMMPSEPKPPVVVNGTSVPDHLQRFLHPNAPMAVPRAITEKSPDDLTEDDLLPDALPGSEILP